jgi:hypothetical protein
VHMSGGPAQVGRAAAQKRAGKWTIGSLHRTPLLQKFGEPMMWMEGQGSEKPTRETERRVPKVHMHFRMEG